MTETDNKDERSNSDEDAQRVWFPKKSAGGWVLIAAIDLAGCFLLYYGTAMLMVPVFIGDPDFWKMRIVYSGIPMFFSLALFFGAGWLVSRLRRCPLSTAMVQVVILSAGLLFGAFVILAIGSAFYTS